MSIIASSRLRINNVINFAVGGLGGNEINTKQDLANYFADGDISKVSLFSITGSIVFASITEVTTQGSGQSFSLFRNNNLTFIFYVSDTNMNFENSSIYQSNNFEYFYSPNINNFNRTFSGGKIKEIRLKEYNFKSDLFFDCDNLEHLYLYGNQINISTTGFYGSFTSLKEVFLESSVYNNSTIRNRILSKNANVTVTEILNTNKPENINSITLTNVSGNDYQIDFTINSSFNTVDKYLVYLEDANDITTSFYHKYTIQNSGDVITIPNGTYNVWIRAQDIYGNRSPKNDESSFNLQSGQIKSITI